MLIANYLHQAGYQPRGIIHVGASFAHEMASYISLQPQLIAWIEADPKVFLTLQAIVATAAKLGSPRQICINALISDTDDAMASFNLFNNNGESSSLFRATDLLRATWPGLDETGEALTLPTCRLDSALSRAGVHPGDAEVLVVDIQGAELLALGSAGDYLEAAQFLEVEMSTIQVYEGAPLAHEVDRFLTVAGFVRETPVPGHGDAIYRRRDRTQKECSS